MDTGLQSLVTIAQFHRLPAEPEQLAHQFAQPGQAFGDNELLQAAKALTLKEKQLEIPLSEIQNRVLPAIAKLKDGSYVILARHGGGADSTDQEKPASNLLIHDLREKAPKTLSYDAFSGIWSGELIGRQGLSESLQQKFDITWFMPALVKYRKLFGEVLIT
jgi:subfamily B ATP-binding cassette protein HlyB/CyaB